MVSDLTAMLPRHIKSLTTALYAKTKGNPFFTFRFLESLVDRKLLSYAKDAKRWTWTGLEDQEATENVVHILPAKVRKLDDETREMLRIAAAFDGLTKPLISRLGLSPMKLKMVVDEGIMRRVKSGDYCFKHDKVCFYMSTFVVFPSLPATHLQQIELVPGGVNYRRRDCI